MEKTQNLQSYFMTETLNRGKFCWFEYMKNILNHSGFSNNWLEKTTYNTKWLKAKIGFTLTDQFKQNWQITFQSFPNALDYKIYYKDELKLEKNLLLRAFKRDAITMCKFRICNHHLYQKVDVTSIPRNDRICNKHWVFFKKEIVLFY